MGGEAVRTGALTPRLIEASGGEVLGEAVLAAMLRRRLMERGVTLTDADLEAERGLILASLSPDANEAARLLGELRRQRGLGELRFRGLLERSAGLRALVAGQVEVTEPALEQAHRLRHGPSDRVRLIVAESLVEAQHLRRRVTSGGESFVDVAIAESTDTSAAQGGLLPLVRPEDTSYPEGLRRAIAGLEVGDVSQPVAVDGGFALVKLVEELPGDGVTLDEARSQLTERVRRRAERVLMEQMARELIRGADVLVLDPELKAQWDRRVPELIRSP
ncbi:MAG: peptidylprolyl isomerase [Planctomycetota bacterium]